MLIALGNLDMDSLFESMKYMAQDKGKVTTNMIPNLSDKRVQKLFLKRGPEHNDGWGIAYLQDNEFIVRKSLKPIYDDIQTESTKSIKTNYAMLHARFKSIGEKKLENNAPFQNGRYVFCHNGTIRKGIKINKNKFNPAGNTDSERFFLSIISKNLPIERAIKESFNTISPKPNSNIILSDKENTYVYSSSRTIPEFFRMQIGRKENFLLVSSEKIPHLKLEWQELPFETVIKINHKTLEITQH